MKNVYKALKKNISNSVDQSQSLKKFYKQATFVLNPQPKHPLHRYLIKLDDKIMRTPYRHKLAVPNQALAFIVTSQFNRQEKHLKTGEMPMLALCRTAVDSDLEGNIAEHLKFSIVEYTKTDTLNFYEDYYSQQYMKLAKPLINKFQTHFSMKIQPSCSLEPPRVQFSQKFDKWLQSLNSWQLIGFQTMTVWLKSTISAYNLTQINHHQDIDTIMVASNLQQLAQMKQNGEVEEKIMILNQIRMMASCGMMMYQHGRVPTQHIKE